MRVTLEQVNDGFWLVDCERCGVISVWQTRKMASIARTEHQCDQFDGTSDG